jgi:predicted nucleotidyltransferase
MAKNKAFTPNNFEYLLQCKLRENLPNYVKERIKACVDLILEKYPETQMIYLIGSYANGSYIDEQTSEDFKNLKSIFQRPKISDFDFETSPIQIDVFKNSNNFTIHLGKNSSGNKTKIYSNGNYTL